MTAAGRTDWTPIVDRAAEIVRAYDTDVTLRQLFYRLVSEQVIPNTSGAYKRLSSLTAEARRQGTFPRLADRGRTIYRYGTVAGPEDALRETIDTYLLDRTAGQDVSLYIGVEKAGLVNQLFSWFGDLGIPVLALGGYSSQDYVDRVVEDVSVSDRAAVLIYAGDFDPSGEDIDRDFVARTGCWAKVLRVALNAAQIEQYDLPPNPGKASDSRASAFIARHGELVQVELDALPPEVLRSLYSDAVEQFWDASAYQAVLDREDEDVSRLVALQGLL